MTSSWEKQFCNLRDRRMASDVVPELKRKSEDVAGDPLLAEYFELIYMDSKNRKKVLYDAKPPYLEDGEAVSAFVGRWQAEVWREFDAAERAKGRAARTIEKGKRRRSPVTGNLLYFKFLNEASQTLQQNPALFWAYSLPSSIPFFSFWA